MLYAAQPAARLRHRVVRHLSRANPLRQPQLLRHLLRAAVIKLIAVALIYGFFF
jgi:hypothetical protein